MTAPGTRVANARSVRLGARVGLAARGMVWLLMGVLALTIAVGGSHRQANQQGALATLAAQPGGTLLLVLLAVGLGCYALWRFAQAAVGARMDAEDAKTRAKDAIRGITYALLCGTAVSIIAGSAGKSQDRQQAGYTAQLMRNPGGRWLVGIVGLVIVGVGGYFIVSGLRGKIFEHLAEHRVPASMRRGVVTLGKVGTTARGVVVALAGILTLVAAVTADPHRSRGLDGALRSLAHQPFGPWLLGLAALGLGAFGVFGVSEAVWSKV